MLLQKPGFTTIVILTLVLRTCANTAIFSVGVAPQLGRVFTAQDNQLNAARTVVLSHAFWQKQFAGEANVIGRQLLLDDQAYTVIGVMPPRFKFWAGEVWVPIGLFADEDFAKARSGMVSLNAMGRLKTGVTLEYECV